MSQVLYGVISFCKIMLGFLIFVRIFPEKRWKQKWVGILGWGILVICAVENAWDSCHGFIPWLQIIIYGIVNAVVIKLFYQSSFLDAWLWNWLYDIGYSLLKIPFIIARGLYLDKGVAYLNVSGTNLFTLCSKKLKGQDPSQSGSSELINISVRPTYSLSLNVTF